MKPLMMKMKTMKTMASLLFLRLTTSIVMKVGHKGLNLWAISYSKGGWLLKLQDCVELDV